MMLQGYHECRFGIYTVGMHGVDSCACSHAWPEAFPGMQASRLFALPLSPWHRVPECRVT